MPIKIRERYAIIQNIQFFNVFIIKAIDYLWFKNHCYSYEQSFWSEMISWSFNTTYFNFFRMLHLKVPPNANIISGSRGVRELKTITPPRNESSSWFPHVIMPQNRLNGIERFKHWRLFRVRSHRLLPTRSSKQTFFVPSMQCPYLLCEVYFHGPGVSWCPFLSPRSIFLFACSSS